MPYKDNDSYRTEAVHHISAPEQLNDMVKITRPSGWLALTGVIIFLATIILWSIFGRIESQIIAPCILFPSSGGPLTVSAEEPASVIQFNAHPGEIIKTGDALLTLHIHPAPGLEPQKITLYSQFDGQILNFLVNPGAVINYGTPLVLFQPLSQDKTLVAHAFVPPTEGKKVQPGMPVYIALDQANPSQYGYIKGQVSQLSLYPKTEAGLERILENQDLVAMMRTQGAPFEALITLQKSTVDSNEYQWTTHRPYGKIDAGSLCTAYITLQKQRPINIAIPALNSILGN